VQETDYLLKFPTRTERIIQSRTVKTLERITPDM
jgi:hypothetical protein